MDSSRCADLIEAIALDRDKVSFTTLFDHYAPRLKSYAERTGCRDDEAEALAQETLLSVWRNAAGFDRAKADGSTWLFTIMRNKRIDLARRTRQANVLYDEIDDGRTAKSGSFQPTRRAELLRNALRRLSSPSLRCVGNDLEKRSDSSALWATWTRRVPTGFWAWLPSSDVEDRLGR